MHSLVCFTGSNQLIQALHQELNSIGQHFSILLASALDQGLRQLVRQQQPSLALIDASSIVDMLAFYIFLRSDPATQDIPVLFLSKDQGIQQYSLIFADDTALHTLSNKDQLFQQLWQLLPQTELLETEVAGRQIASPMRMSV